MSYFARLAEQAGVAVNGLSGADTSVAAAPAADSAMPISFPDAAPDMLEIDELVEIAVPSLAAAAPLSVPPGVPPAPRADDKPLSFPYHTAAKLAESLPPARAAPQPRAVAFGNDPLAPSPAAAAAPDGKRPAPDPTAGETSRLTQALKWVASDPGLPSEPARMPSPERAKPDVIHAATRPAESATQAPRAAPVGEMPVVHAAPSHRMPRAEVEHTPPQAAAVIAAPPATSTPPPSDAPAPRTVRAPLEAQVEEVVQVSIGNIHVRVEAPVPRAMPEPATAAPRAAPAHPPQAPSARLRRRYFHL